MPLYQYQCEDCGEFSEWMPMNRATDPVTCPSCGSDAPRTISLPALALMDGATRKVHSINERSAHDPKLRLKEDSDSPGARRHDHRHDHGHAQKHGHGHAHHNHSHGASRPWMIGH